MKPLLSFFQRPYKFFWHPKPDTVNFAELALFIFIFVLFIMNGLYLMYPDEFVNIIAGKAMNMNIYPYKGYFDHHLPGAWSISAFIQQFTFGSFVLFRVAWAAISFVLLFLVGVYIRNTNRQFYPYYLFFFFVYPLFSVYFWLHTYIADGLAVLFFSMSFWIVLNESVKPKVNPGAIFIAAFINFILIFSSLTFIYMTVFLYCWQGYLLIRKGWNTRLVGWFIGLAALPYLLFAIHLLVTGTVKDFYMSNFYYNTVHYVRIANYTPGAQFNPIKFAMTIVYNFYNDYLPLLSKIKYMDLYLPIGTLAAAATLLMAIFLIAEAPILGILYIGMLSFSAPRSSIMDVNETNYQIGMFLVFGLISSLYVIYRNSQVTFADISIEWFKRASVLVVTILLVFTTVFLGKNVYDKAYLRYTQIMPGISDNSFLAMFVDELIEPGDYFWIGPYEPHHVYFVKDGIMTGRYPTMLPQFRESEYFSNDFIRQFEQNPPKILILKHESSIFGTPADVFSAYFQKWMVGKYTNIEQLGGYEQLRSPTEILLRSDLYINLEYKDEILTKLLDAGYIRPL